MRKTRVKKIKALIDYLVLKDVIQEDNRRNAERYFKRAWKNGSFESTKTDLEALQDGI